MRCARAAPPLLEARVSSRAMAVCVIAPDTAMRLPLSQLVRRMSRPSSIVPLAAAGMCPTLPPAAYVAATRSAASARVTSSGVQPPPSRSRLTAANSRPTPRRIVASPISCACASAGLRNLEATRTRASSASSPASANSTPPTTVNRLDRNAR